MEHEHKNTSLNHVFQLSLCKPKTERASIECQVCGAPASFSSYGAVVCSSCRIFFKRNAENKQKELKCHFDGHCEINFNTRHVCAHCRLAKCFAVGMTAELFQTSISKKPNKNDKKKTTTEIVPSNQSPLLPTLNLLQADQSTLTIDQWNLLSNLMHCYDEHSKMLNAVEYFNEQKKLPMKARFKISTVDEFVTSLLNAGQLLFEKNSDFLSLGFHDQYILLENSMRHTAGLGAAFILYKTKLLDSTIFFEHMTTLYGKNTMEYFSGGIELLTPDVIFVKLSLAILMITPLDYTYFSYTKPIYFNDAMSIFRIQNSYIDLVWRYMLHRYDHQYAVLCFSNLIRSLFALDRSIANAAEQELYNNMVDALIQQTEEILRRLE